jgi:1-acyl-sn-glycerol-3-phosphate acyltransferase
MTLSKVRCLLVTAPLIILMTIIMGTVSLLMSLVDSKGYAQHRIARQWSRFLLWIAGARVRREGIGNLRPDKSYVFVSNHASFMDTPVVLAHLPVQFRFLAKKGLFHIPLLGTHLKRAGHLPVVRNDPRASLRSMSDAARIIREKNVSVLLFPEGGRSQAEVKDFKEGAAYIAIKAGVPIVPVGLIGTREVMPMGSMWVHFGNVTLKVGEPIPTDRLTIKDRTELTQTLHDQVLDLVGQPVSRPQETR